MPMARWAARILVGEITYYRSVENQRLAHHLLRERDAVFPFLYCPGLEATNWRAEQAIRPMVVTRKVWGGNRTARGANTQGVLLSLFQTCRQQHRPNQPVLQQLLCSPHPIALNFTAPHRSPLQLNPQFHRKTLTSTFQQYQEFVLLRGKKITLREGAKNGALRRAKLCCESNGHVL